MKLIETCEIRNNMVKSKIIKGSVTYKRAKFMCLLNMKDRLYFNIPFKQHIEDIEQTLIDYDIKNEDFFSALWVANSDIPFRKRLEIFGKSIVKLAFGFSRTNFLTNKGTNSSIKKPESIITLLLAQRITNINYAINTNNNQIFDMYVESYDEFKESIYDPDIKTHKKMWEYLDLCCKEVKSINNLFFYI